AFRTLPIRIETGRQDGTAIGTPRSSYRAHHPRCARAELIGSPRSPVWWRPPIVLPLFLFFFFRIAVPAMAIFAIHKRLRPSVSPHRLLQSSVICAKGAALTLA